MVQHCIIRRSAAARLLRAEEMADLQQHGLRLRPYSASALERFAACPYRFYLSAILRLMAREEPERIEAIDRRTRGTLVHAVYANVLRALHARV